MVIGFTAGLMVGALAAVANASTGYIIVAALGLGIPLGILAAFKHGSEVDRGVVTLAVFGVSAPAFATGIALLYVFGVILGWFPIFGPGEGFADRAWHLTLPAIALGISVLGLVVKITRASMLEELQKDYVAFARARGLPRRRITTSYLLRNALIPVVTVVGLSLPALVGGAVLTETVFAWPGIGRLAVGAVFERDYPVIMGVNLLVATVVITANLLTDLAYCVIDPRISYS